MSDSDEKESIEILESGFDNANLLNADSTESDSDFIAVPKVRIYDEISTDSDYEKVQNIEEVEPNETDEPGEFEMKGKLQSITYQKSIFRFKSVKFCSLESADSYFETHICLYLFMLVSVVFLT